MRSPLFYLLCLTAAQVIVSGCGSGGPGGSGSAIDPATGRRASAVAHLVPAGFGASGSAKVYVANEESGSISVVNPTTKRRVRTIALGERLGREMLMFSPHNVQVAPDGRSVWVTAPPMEHGEGMEGTEEVIVIDPAKDRIVGRIPLGMDLHLTHVVLDGSSRYAYVVAKETSQVIQIDAGTRTEVRRYDLGAGRGPHGLRFSRGRLFVANMEGESLSIVDTASGAVTEVPVGGMAVQTACTADGRFVFASLYDTREVVRYDLTSGSLTRIALPQGSQGPIQLYPSPDSRRLYVCDQGNLLGRPPSNKLYEIDINAATIAATIQVGMGAHGVVVSDGGARVYVTNTVANTVSVIDAATRRVVATVPVGDAPNGISYQSRSGGMP